jgi:hypothetical protein
MIAFNLIFSAIGHGEEVYRYLQRNSFLADLAFALLMVVLTVMYLFDASQWNRGCWQHLKQVLYALSVVCFGISCIFGVDRWAMGPLASFMILQSSWLLSVKGWVVPYRKTGKFLVELKAPLIMCSLATVTFWLHWVFAEGHTWEADKESYEITMGCIPGRVDAVTNGTEIAGRVGAYIAGNSHLDFDNLVNKTNGIRARKEGGGDSCMPAFLLWFSPVLVSVLAMIYAELCR